MRNDKKRKKNKKCQESDVMKKCNENVMRNVESLKPIRFFADIEGCLSKINKLSDYSLISRHFSISSWTDCRGQ